MMKFKFLLLALVVVSATPRAEIIEQVLVKVNGEIFTKTDLEARQVSALRSIRRAGLMMPSSRR
jgi:hypothetical protein